MTRQFTVVDATRERVPLFIGLVGPSGSGKTRSALRLAKGIQDQAGGGPIVFIDTESRRGLHYADKLAFKWMEFEAPFGPLDYLGALEHALKMQPAVVIVDSMSHEHEGAGGVLEQHNAFLDAKAGDDFGKRQRMSMLAWAKPKQDRRKLINRLLQMPFRAVIFCFRAKEKMKVIRGQEPEALGWMPIAGEEFVYEMTTNILLLPGSQGTPVWDSGMPGERAIMKLPEQFNTLLRGQLNEDMGYKMAEWAAGVDPIEAAIEKLRGAAMDGRDAMMQVWTGLSRDVRAQIPKDRMPQPVEKPVAQQDGEQP